MPTRKEQMETVLSYIEAGKSDGAKLVAGGERADIGTGKATSSSRPSSTTSKSITASQRKRTVDPSFSWVFDARISEARLSG
jgi:hypothetical protein